VERRLHRAVLPPDLELPRPVLEQVRDAALRVALALERVEETPGPPAGHRLPVREDGPDAEDAGLRVRPDVGQRPGPDVQDARLAHVRQVRRLAVADPLRPEHREVLPRRERVDVFRGVRELTALAAAAAIRRMGDSTGGAATPLSIAANVRVPVVERPLGHCGTALSKSGPAPSCTQ
jgi:hypothetical protein